MASDETWARPHVLGSLGGVAGHGRDRVVELTLGDSGPVPSQSGSMGGPSRTAAPCASRPGSVRAAAWRSSSSVPGSSRHARPTRSATKGSVAAPNCCQQVASGAAVFGFVPQVQAQLGVPVPVVVRSRTSRQLLLPLGGRLGAAPMSYQHTSQVPLPLDAFLGREPHRPHGILQRPRRSVPCVRDSRQDGGASSRCSDRGESTFETGRSPRRHGRPLHCKATPRRLWHQAFAGSRRMACSNSAMQGSQRCRPRYMQPSA